MKNAASTHWEPSFQYVRSIPKIFSRKEVFPAIKMLLKYICDIFGCVRYLNVRSTIKIISSLRIIIGVELPAVFILFFTNKKWSSRCYATWQVLQAFWKNLPCVRYILYGWLYAKRTNSFFISSLLIVTTSIILRTPLTNQQYYHFSL